MTLPPHYHQESKCNATNLLTSFMASYNISALTLWKPVHSNFKNIANITIPEKLQDLDMVPIDRLVKELNSVNSVPPLINFWSLSNWAYALMGIWCALILGIILFVYYKVSKRRSGKLWQRRDGLKREDEEGYPLVTINSSGDGDAGRNINPSLPMVTTVYSIGTDEPGAIRKLYPLIIGDPEKNKSDN